MRQINIIPYAFSYDKKKSYKWKSVKKTIAHADNTISFESNSWREIIWKIVSHYAKEDSHWIIERLYLRIWSNYVNNRTKAKVKNTDISDNWQLDSDETVLNDLVIVLSFQWATWSVLTTSSWIDMWIIYLIYEWHSAYAINSLEYIIENTLLEYNISFSSFLSSDKPLKEIRHLIKEFEMNLISIKDEKEVIIWKTSLKNKDDFASIDNPVEKIRELTESLFEYMENSYETVKRRIYIKALGKKIPVNDDWKWFFFAKWFPQQINVSEFKGEYDGIKSLFLKIFKPTISNTIENDANLELTIFPFIREYEQSIITKK